MGFGNPLSPAQLAAAIAGTTLTVTGTVTTTTGSGGGGTTAPRFRSSRTAQTSTGSSVTLATPADTVAGDLLIAVSYGVSNAASPPAGWTTIAQPGFGLNGVFSRTATSADAAGGASYTFASVNSSGSGFIATVGMIAIIGGTSAAYLAGGTPGEASTTTYSRTTSASQLLLLLAGQGGDATGWNWSYPSTGGPPIPRPSIEDAFRVTAGTVGFAGLAQWTQPTWTTATAYAYQFTAGASGGGGIRTGTLTIT